MNKKKKKIDSKEVGLVAGIILGKTLFKTDDLHYGYWTPDLKLDIQNIVHAQENHSNFIISNIPEGVSTILDVGCGAGALAKRLLAKGYHVDCVSPSMLLTREAKKLTGGKAPFADLAADGAPADPRRAGGMDGVNRVEAARRHRLGGRPRYSSVQPSCRVGSFAGVPRRMGSTWRAQ